MDGQRDWIAAETKLSRVDGIGGELLIAGDLLVDISEQPFEAVAARLLNLSFDTGWSEPGFASALGAARERAYERFRSLHSVLAGLSPIDALRAFVALRPEGDAAADAVELIADTGVAVALLHAEQAGLELLAPDSGKAHAADLQRMLSGGAADPAKAAALNTYMVSVVDHGMNASTFTARVVASTASDPNSAIASAIGALKGPLHGGAPGPVLDMLDAIDAPENAESWIAGELDAGRRLMGFGHRIYRTRDPRADVLKGALRRLGSLASSRLALAEAVERVALGALAEKYPARSLETNVEFYTALLLDAVGLDRAFFTPAFAAGRVAGWLAHAMEQSRSGALIRPKSRYVGAVPEGDDFRAAANG